MVKRHEYRASEYVRHFAELARRRFGVLVVLCVRVSHKNQRANGNLATQIANCVRAVELAGGTVVCVYEWIGSGKDPSWIARPAALAKRLGAVLVFESLDRAIRHKAFDPNENPDAQPGRRKLRKLLSVAGGVPIATLLHPDASPNEIRSYQRTRGQQERDKRGGRPPVKRPGYKKRQRVHKCPIVRRMRRQGATLSQIAKKTGIPRSTVSRWTQ